MKNITTSNPPRSFSLDFIRCISVLMIILYHFNNGIIKLTSKEFIMFDNYFFAGNIGTSMFFILSGASLMISAKNKFQLTRFYQKRFTAIFPLFYYIYIFFVLCFVIIGQGNLFSGVSPVKFLLTIVGVDGLFLYKARNYYIIGEWFLGCLLFIYLFFPVTRYFFLKNKYITLAVSLIVAIGIEFFYNFKMPLFTFPPFRVFEFIFGMFFVSLALDFDFKKKASFAIALLIPIIVIFVNKYHGQVFVGHILLGILSFSFISLLASYIDFKILRSIVTFLSKYSYAAFLLHHQIVIELIFRLRPNITSANYSIALFFISLLVIYSLSIILQSSLRYILRTQISYG